MPEIGTENFDETFGQIWDSPEHQVDFARAGERIVYFLAETPEQVDRALAMYRLDTPEDAGFLRAYWDMKSQRRTIELGGNSNYLGLPENLLARIRTSGILRRYAADFGIRIFTRRFEPLQS